MNTSTLPLTTTESATDGFDRLWIDIFLPITVFGFVLLFFVICYGSILKLFSACRSCRNRSNRTSDHVSRARSSSHQGHENPRYHTDSDNELHSDQQRQEIEIPDFEVVVEDISVDLPYQIPDEREQTKPVSVLPTYDEFIYGKAEMFANKKGNQGTAKSFTDGEQKPPASENEPIEDEHIDDTSASITDSPSPPPPYTENE